MHRYLPGLCTALCAVFLAVFAGAPPAAAEGAVRTVQPSTGPVQVVDAAAMAAPGVPPGDPTALLAALLAGGGVLCFGLGLRARVVRAQTEARLEAFVAPSLGVTRPARGGPSLLNRTLTPLAPLVAWLAEFTGSVLPARQIERIRANLAVAGLPYSRQVAQFLAAKAGLAIAGALLPGLYLLRGGAPLLQVLMLAALGGALGFYLPGIWLGRRMAQRQQQVLKALPDALDLLSISVSAGLGFDGAMVEVVQRWQNPLTEELAAVLRDVKLGQSRRDALREFARRTGVEEVANFVAAVIQADELGTPMREVLHIQSEQMRMRRRHRAEERARKATIKMLIPMVMFIFPALFVVLLGPALPSLSVLGDIAQTATR